VHQATFTPTWPPDTTQAGPMICSPRVLLSLAKLTCLAIVIIQTSLNIYDEFHTNKTEDDTYTKLLSKIEFPIVFNVIISPSFQAKKFKDFGFRSSLEYFLGMNSLTPSSSGGWAGYSEDGITYNVSGKKKGLTTGCPGMSCAIFFSLPIGENVVDL
jgi:hypothetical protein